MYYANCVDCKEYLRSTALVARAVTENSIWADLGYEVGARYYLCFDCAEHKNKQEAK